MFEALHRFAAPFAVVAFLSLAPFGTTPSYGEDSASSSPAVQATGALPTTGVPEPGDYLQTIESGGMQRKYWVHLPTGFDFSRQRPLMVVIHGAFSKGSKVAEQYGFDRLADREDFIAVYPEGIGFKGKFQHWNAGFCCGKAKSDEVDDVAFLDAVIREVVGRLQVNRAKIYMVGESNGGMLTYLYAAKHAETLAGIGVVYGTIGGQGKKDPQEWRIPKPTAPLPVVAIHGRKDKRVAYDGGKNRGGGKVVSAQDSAMFWVHNNLCAKKPKKQTLWDGKVERQFWSGCTLRSEVVLYSLDGWGHNWPGAGEKRRISNSKGEVFDAPEVIWEFLVAKRRWVQIPSGMRPAQKGSTPPTLEPMKSPDSFKAVPPAPTEPEESPEPKPPQR
ncbi:MAG: hypothetical protein K0U98_03915 [Deltaproteobacteria bacterium]|nr:hypothetical protein [Deltaproteobacteria bacterium]